VEEKEDEYVHQLIIWRDDFVDFANIYGLTSEVRLKAKEFDGIYDGWETFFIGAEKK